MTNRIGYYGLADGVSHNDDRQEIWKQQVIDRGFDDTELWSLDAAFMKFIVPRLVAFREHSLHYGFTKDGDIDDTQLLFIIETFSDEISKSGTRQNYDDLTKAMSLFSENIFSYWY